MAETNSNRRQYFRLVYPSSMMPLITIGEGAYEVPEIAEGGIRVRSKSVYEIARKKSLADATSAIDTRATETTDRCDDFRIGENVYGTIQLIGGESISVSGTIYRRDKLEYIIAPLAGLSFKEIVAEQLILLNRFPALRK